MSGCADRAVVPARYEEPVFGVEVKNRVTAQKSAGDCMAAPRRSWEYGVGRLLKTRAILNAARRAGQDSSRKVYPQFSFVEGGHCIAWRRSIMRGCRDQLGYRKCSDGT